MADTAYSTLHPDILPEASGCSVPLMDRHIQRAAQDFFAKSLAWRYDITPITIVANVPKYSISIPANTKIRQILSVRVDGRKVNGRSKEWLDANIRDWDSQTVSRPNMYTSDGENTLRLVRVPKITVISGLEARVALQPTLNATGIDEDMMIRWGKYIVHGALATLMDIKDSSWHDPTRASEHRVEFSHGIQTALSEAGKNFIGESRMARNNQIL